MFVNTSSSLLNNYKYNNIILRANVKIYIFVFYFELCGMLLALYDARVVSCLDFMHAMI